MPLGVGDAGCAPCEQRQAAMLGWANGRGRLVLGALVLAAIAFTLWPTFTRTANPA